MIALLQVYILFALYAVVFVTSLVALIDAAGRPAPAFPRAGKRTKGFWTLLLGVATAVAFVALPWPVGIGQLSFLALGSAVAALVYLYDVKPALGPRGRRGPRGTSSGGGW